MKTQAPVTSLSLESHRALVEAGCAPLDEYVHRLEAEEVDRRRPDPERRRTKRPVTVAAG